MHETAQFFGVGPVLPVHDIARSVEFYCTALGFDLDFVMGEPPTHGSVTRGRVGIQFTPAPPSFEAAAFPGWIYLFVEKIDALYAEYTTIGLPMARPLADHTHGMREFELVDCNGFRLRFGQYL